MNFGLKERTDKFQSVYNEGTCFYIAVNSKNNDGLDSSGFIYQTKNIERFDERSTFIFPNKEKLVSPKGILALKGVLYVSDLNRIMAFDQKTGDKTDWFDLQRFSSDIRDIVNNSDSTIVFSASDKSSLFELNLRTREICEITSPKVDGISGLFYDAQSKKLYVCGFGSKAKKGDIWEVDLDKETSKLLVANAGKCSAVKKFNELIIFTTWDDGKDAPSLYTTPESGGKVSSWEMPEGTWGKNWRAKPHMIAPCQFEIVKKTNKQAKLYIPDLVQGAIYHVSLIQE